MSAKMSDFQKSFLSRGGMTVYTQTEFDEQLAKAQAQIMQVAIDTTKTAIAIEREKQIKAGSRKKKVELIKSINPGLKYLYEEI